MGRRQYQNKKALFTGPIFSEGFEYREEASLPTTMRECSRSDLELKGPNRATANVVLMATMVLLLSFGLQFVILDNVKSATMVNAVILNLGMYEDLVK